MSSIWVNSWRPGKPESLPEATAWLSEFLLGVDRILSGQGLWIGLRLKFRSDDKVAIAKALERRLSGFGPKVDFGYIEMQTVSTSGNVTVKFGYGNLPPRVGFNGCSATIPRSTDQLASDERITRDLVALLARIFPAYPACGFPDESFREGRAGWVGPIQYVPLPYEEARSAVRDADVQPFDGGVIITSLAYQKQLSREAIVKDLLRIKQQLFDELGYARDLIARDRNR